MGEAASGAPILMTSCIGWLLDISIENEYAILWIKTEENRQILKLRDSYYPGFYILPRNEPDGLSLFQILSRQEQQDTVVRKLVGKRTSLQAYLIMSRQRIITEG